MRRLNVRAAQINECIQKSMFALSTRPQNPELTPGELLLLQMVKEEAGRLGKLRSRVDFALVFDHLERDHDGTLSGQHWPAEGRVWPWIVYCSETVPTIPFSLEDLRLTQAYDGQDNARLLRPEDEASVIPFSQWALAQRPEPDRQLVAALAIPLEFGKPRALQGLFNHYRIAILKSQPPLLITEQRYARNPWLSDTLKAYYDHRSQVCGNDFQPHFGVPMADAHHIHYLSRGGPDVSGNIVVLCPNHHRIVHATDAVFDRQKLTYTYGNGLVEQLLKADHFIQAPVTLHLVRQAAAP